MNDHVIGKITHYPPDDDRVFWCKQCAEKREGDAWGVEFLDGEYEELVCRACLVEIRARITAALEAE